MTDRHAGYIITLKEDIREEESQAVISALGLMRGVISVEPVASDLALHIAQRRARTDLGQRILDLIWEK